MGWDGEAHPKEDLNGISAGNALKDSTPINRTIQNLYHISLYHSILYNCYAKKRSGTKKNTRWIINDDKFLWGVAGLRSIVAEKPCAISESSYFRHIRFKQDSIAMKPAEQKSLPRLAQRSEQRQWAARRGQRLQPSELKNNWPLRN